MKDPQRQLEIQKLSQLRDKLNKLCSKKSHYLNSIFSMTWYMDYVPDEDYDKMCDWIRRTEEYLVNRLAHPDHMTHEEWIEAHLSNLPNKLIEDSGKILPDKTVKKFMEKILTVKTRAEGKTLLRNIDQAKKFFRKVKFFDNVIENYADLFSAFNGDISEMADFLLEGTTIKCKEDFKHRHGTFSEAVKQDRFAWTIQMGFYLNILEKNKTPGWARLFTHNSASLSHLVYESYKKNTRLFADPERNGHDLVVIERIVSGESKKTIEEIKETLQQVSNRNYAGARKFVSSLFIIHGLKATVEKIGEAISPDLRLFSDFKRLIRLSESSDNRYHIYIWRVLSQCLMISSEKAVRELMYDPLDPNKNEIAYVKNAILDDAIRVIEAIRDRGYSAQQEFELASYGIKCLEAVQARHRFSGEENKWEAEQHKLYMKLKETFPSILSNRANSD